MVVTLPDHLYTAAQVRAMDELACKSAGLDANVLMARAAEALWQCFTQNWPEAKSLVVVAGIGNNAGDGFVLARLAAAFGLKANVLLVSTAENYTGAAREAYLALEGTRVAVSPYQTQALQDADVIIDALLGTGLTRPLDGIFLQAVQDMNHSGKPILSADIPSGLCADTGMPKPLAVCARATVSFVGLKAGLFTALGKTHSGRIYFDDLKIPKNVSSSLTPLAKRIDKIFIKKNLKARLAHEHKNDHGHVLVVGGDVSMSGAACLAATAALRSGAGLVSVATRAEHAALMSVQRPELMVHGVSTEADLNKLIERVNVIAMGLGWGKVPGPKCCWPQPCKVLSHSWWMRMRSMFWPSIPWHART